MKLNKAIGRLIDAVDDLELEIDNRADAADLEDAWDALFDAAIEVRAAHEEEHCDCSACGGGGTD